MTISNHTPATHHNAELTNHVCGGLMNPQEYFDPTRFTEQEVADMQLMWPRGFDHNLYSISISDAQHLVAPVPPPLTSATVHLHCAHTHCHTKQMHSL